jgi:hypothetical protein
MSSNSFVCLPKEKSEPQFIRIFRMSSKKIRMCSQKNLNPNSFVCIPIHSYVFKKNRTPIHSYIFQFIRISSPQKKYWGAINSYIFRIHSYVLRTQSSEGGRVMLSSKRTTAEYPPGKLRRPWTSSVPGGGGGATRLPRRSRTGCSEAQALESRSPEAPRKDGCATHSQPNKANPPVPEPYV